MLFLPLLFTGYLFFSSASPAHADSTLDQIVSDLGITDPTQLNLLGSSFGKISDPLGCEKDFLELITSKKLSLTVFASCNKELSDIVPLLAPHIEAQQHITQPSLFLPFALASNPAEAIIFGIYGTNLGQSLMGLISSAVQIRGCLEYLAVLSEVAPAAALLEIAFSGALLVGFVLACSDIASSILTLVAPLIIALHPHALGDITPTPLAPTAPLYCPNTNLSSLACLSGTVSSGGSTGGGNGSGSGITPTSTPTPPPPPTCSPAANQAALFTGKNYTGQCVVLDGGTYNDPASMNIPNDSVSSVKVGNSAQLELCRDSGLSNTCEWFSSDNSDLSTTSINAVQTSSAQVVDLSRYVTVCTATQLHGTCKSFGAGIVSDLSIYGLSSDIVSIHVSSAVTLYLNDGVNLSGQPGIFNNDSMDLTTNGWNSRAKSLKIENRYDTSCNNDQSQNGILLYRNTNVDPGGGCVLLTADNNDLGKTLNFANGSSLQFVGNYINHY
jgi:hypothetical protein